MNKLKKYQKAIKTVIEKHRGGLTPKYDEYSDIVSFDDERGHYFLMGVGWKDSKRIQDITIHIDIKDKKVWIQSDWTDTVFLPLIIQLKRFIQLFKIQFPIRHF